MFRKRLKYTGITVSLLVMAGTLYGCMANVVRTSAECEFTAQGRTCTIRIEAEGNFLTGGTISPADIQLMQLRLVPENIALLNSSGFFVLKGGL